MTRKNVYHQTSAPLVNFKCSECSRWWSIVDPPTSKLKWYCPWCGDLLDPANDQTELSEEIISNSPGVNKTPENKDKS